MFGTFVDLHPVWITLVGQGHGSKFKEENVVKLATATSSELLFSLLLKHTFLNKTLKYSNKIF